MDKQKQKAQGRIEVISPDALSNQEHHHKNILQDTTVDIPSVLEAREELEELGRAQQKLQKDERQLIVKIYYERKSENQVESETGISQSTINGGRFELPAPCGAAVFETVAMFEDYVAHYSKNIWFVNSMLK